jgi:hypothetical protein
MTFGLSNPTARVEPCLWCGGEIVATRLSDTEVISAVQRHQAEPAHQAARARIEAVDRIEPASAGRSIEAELARELYGSAVWRSA